MRWTETIRKRQRLTAAPPLALTLGLGLYL
jgi:hypothetical protein